MAPMRNQRLHTHRLSTSAITALATAALSGLVLAACGGGEETAGAGGSSGGSGGDDRARLEQAALKHAECMRKQGVDVPDPKPGEGGIILAGPRGGGDPGVRKRAGRRCEKYLRDVPPPKLSESQKTAMRDGALRHARCMRKQGIDFPDPAFDDKGGIKVKIGDGFDPGDPRVRRAEQKCQKLLPRPGADPLG